MIKSFKHKGLEDFFLTGSTKGIDSRFTNRIRLCLSALDTAKVIEDMNIPKFKLHPLKGDKKHLWSITVTGNCRMTFKFEAGDVYIVNYEDYH